MAAQYILTVVQVAAVVRLGLSLQHMELHTKMAQAVHKGMQVAVMVQDWAVVEITVGNPTPVAMVESISLGNYGCDSDFNFYCISFLYLSRRQQHHQKMATKSIKDHRLVTIVGAIAAAGADTNFTGA